MAPGNARSRKAESGQRQGIVRSLRAVGVWTDSRRPETAVFYDRAFAPIRDRRWAPAKVAGLLLRNVRPRHKRLLIDILGYVDYYRVVQGRDG